MPPQTSKALVALNYYGRYATKKEYDRAFQEARDWALEDMETDNEGVKRPKSECAATSARIFGVKEPALRKAELGLGATLLMVRAGINHLRAPSLSLVSQSWFKDWLRRNPDLYTIKTKPIERVRLESHTEEEIKKWFEELQKDMVLYNINIPKKLLNMDESRARIGCPPRETVIVLKEVKEMYTSSPNNRKSIIIIEIIRADGKKTLPLYIITPSKKIIENWITDELTSDETIDCSLTGYINY
ncbi:multidrug resistance protein fnx1 [Drepanopeziza brunnea f. sp. 'multigermtubi' MB_m1]|uniref:Multidrug resistance protein fnx1 n=1 Tax=Marssonina brunnea f. sp. multigermtubi (strain MB_m1) TaxID=1072389 RepID=K1X090_MARBU|nr:multidrug resistance protein fnx1 [Drepanopeziza brunnea f. sp. 'multigermtubi' MB_m1]EKD14288.1 multidrug resistance protein fnx1 [Drepanopeziza brunnea f. sp. 'multigermtubi' MB_m1]